jgi:hypothetical protein
LEKEMVKYGDAAPLVVPDPAPAQWWPPAQEEEPKKAAI